MTVRILLLAMLCATTAWADVSSDAALAASTVIDQHCAGAWGSEEASSIESLEAVLPVYKQTVQAYEAEAQPYLLYWRAVLAQCLGRFEPAKADLIEFVESQEGSEIYADQVRQARLHLRRVGVHLEAAGAGIAASWIRAADALEVRVFAGAGAALREVTCTAEDTAPQHNAGCVGPNWRPRYSGGLRYLGRFEVDGFFAPAIGAGVRVEASGHSRDPKVDGQTPLPLLRVDVGPQIRLSNADGRAVGVRIEPRFVLGLSEQAPWTGYYDLYPENLNQTDPASGDYEDGLLERLRPQDGGSFLVPQIGGSLRLAIQAEASNTLVVQGHVDVAGFAPTPGSWIKRQSQAAASVEVPLEAIGANRLRWGGGVTFLALPTDGSLAIGPFLDITGDVRWLNVPETNPGGGDVAWLIPVGTINTQPNARMRSTRQTTLAGVVGIRVDFGAGAK